VGHFKQVLAWQNARALAILSIGAIKSLPATDRNALADQWRRSAYSVVLNIAEGARRGKREFRRYLGFARSSLDEIEAILDLVSSFDYLPAQDIEKLEATRQECARTVSGLMRALGDGHG
jgi:four helix bundle protein